MKGNYEQFVQSLNAKNGRDARRYLVIQNFDYKDITLQELEHIVLSCKPKTLKEVSNICGVIMQYAKFLGFEESAQKVLELDRGAIWNTASKTAQQKYITHEEYVRLLKRIRVEEERNSLLKIAFIRCIYEGVYSNRFESLVNLKGSDIHDGVVDLHVDGETFSIDLPEDLIEDLLELSRLQTAQGNNRHGAFDVPAQGMHPDSCFKFAYRGGRKDFNSIFYQLLISIRKKYLDFEISPRDLFISGIMHRAAMKMKEHGIDIEKVMTPYSKETEGIQIIMDELKRSHYEISFTGFRVMTSGHILNFKYE